MWLGGQNGGNQCHRTAYRKNDEKQNEDSLRDFWDNIKCTNIHIIRVPEEREKEPKKIFKEIIAANFPNIGSKIANQVWEAWRVPGRINSRRNTLRHTVINLTKNKNKDKILKATGKKKTTKNELP